MLVLAHESYHTAGVADEAAANCFAIQAMAWTAVQLGAAAGEAELLARAMEALEPRQGGEYGTAECHAGGKFDLHPETAAFPTEHPLVAAARPRRRAVARRPRLGPLGGTHAPACRLHLDKQVRERRAPWTTRRSTSASRSSSTRSTSSGSARPRATATRRPGKRLAEVKVSLDQTWDLLRQREALRAAHMDPDVAVERDPSVVENYRQ